MLRAQYLDNGWSRSAKNLGKYIEINYKVGQVDRLVVDRVDRRGAESSWVVSSAKSRVDRSSWSVFASDRSSKVDSIDFGVYLVHSVSCVLRPAPSEAHSVLVDTLWRWLSHNRGGLSTSCLVVVSHQHVRPSSVYWWQGLRHPRQLLTQNRQPSPSLLVAQNSGCFHRLHQLMLRLLCHLCRISTVCLIHCQPGCWRRMSASWHHSSTTSAVPHQYQIHTNPVRIGNTSTTSSVLPVSSVRDLGIYLDTDISMTTHVIAVANSATWHSDTVEVLGVHYHNMPYWHCLDNFCLGFSTALTSHRQPPSNHRCQRSSPSMLFHLGHGHGTNEPFSTERPCFPSGCVKSVEWLSFLSPNRFITVDISSDLKTFLFWWRFQWITLAGGLSFLTLYSVHLLHCWQCKLFDKWQCKLSLQRFVPDSITVIMCIFNNNNNRPNNNLTHNLFPIGAAQIRSQPPDDPTVDCWNSVC